MSDDNYFEVGAASHGGWLSVVISAGIEEVRGVLSANRERGTEDARRLMALSLTLKTDSSRIYYSVV